MFYKKGGFTLIELLIVIGIIAILASGVIVAINPGRQFAQARDATRESHINTLYKSLVSYQVDNKGNLSELSLPTTLTEICNTNLETPDCSTDSLVDLSTLVDNGYINSLPIDPQGSVSTTSDGTGYFVAEGSIILVADKAETKFVGIGTTEGEYAGAGGGSTFNCGDDLDYGEKTYPTVEIGSQCWMAANLNTGTIINGSSEQTDDGTIDKYCYNDNESNCDTYGGLYQWDEAMQYSTTEGVQGICPTGWHIPTDNEWHTLEDYLTADGNTCDPNREVAWDCDPAGGKLKVAGTIYWDTETCGSASCNSSGFTAISSGRRGTTISFSMLGSRAYWWSSSPGVSGEALRRVLRDVESEIYRNDRDIDYGFSVRCIKD
jgi:uncharacterized protein (TIGR02145 family)/prepilin-type N-terminal cleavage/methylation domain-containing protein